MDKSPTISNFSFDESENTNDPREINNTSKRLQPSPLNLPEAIILKGNPQANSDIDREDITIVQYNNELELPQLMKLIGNDLSEPYSIFTYRYFLKNWPNLSFLAKDPKGKIIGAVVSKLDLHKGGPRLRGYIAMLAVDKTYRGRGIGSSLAKRSILAMHDGGAHEIVLEAEQTNKNALALYSRLGFIRAKRLHRYYLTGVDAFRLKLWL